MSKIQYRDQLGLSQKNINKLDLINDIIEEYQEQGYHLTLRQLYYQLGRFMSRLSRGNIEDFSQYSQKHGVFDMAAIF